VNRAPWWTAYGCPRKLAEKRWHAPALINRSHTFSPDHQSSFNVPSSDAYKPSTFVNANDSGWKPDVADVEVSIAHGIHKIGARWEKCPLGLNVIILQQGCTHKEERSMVQSGKMPDSEYEMIIFLYQNPSPLA
jgi:hypothetical protein